MESIINCFKRHDCSKYKQYEFFCKIINDIENNEFNFSIFNQKLELTEAEIFVIYMLVTCFYSWIQDAAYNPNKLNEFNRILISNLDSALKKIPQTKATTLFRRDEYYPNPQDIKKGDIILIKGFFTTSKEDIPDDEMTQFVITPLDQIHTKAHNLYIALDYGNEKQVEFERDTKFLVEKVIKGEKNHTIFIKELTD